MKLSIFFALSALSLAFAAQALAAETNRMSEKATAAEDVAVSHTISTEELKQAIAQNEGFVIVDVRSPEEFATGRVPGAINIPLDSIEKRSAEIPKDKSVVLTCRSGRRSGLAQETLRQLGYTNIRNHIGGILQWTGPIEK
jgi:rhodanese-related sulfurtransferase